MSTYEAKYEIGKDFIDYEELKVSVGCVEECRQSGSRAALSGGICAIVVDSR